MAISRPARADDDVAGKQIKRTIWSGVLAGVGLVAFADETVFYQLLHWHHFYDESTLAVGLVSDGLFHAGGFTAMVAGLFLLADALRRGGFVPKRWWGALLLGAGGFQLYDGIVQHKLLGLHQNPLPRHPLVLRPDLEPDRGRHDRRRGGADDGACRRDGIGDVPLRRRNGCVSARARTHAARADAAGRRRLRPGLVPAEPARPPMAGPQGGLHARPVPGNRT